MDPNEGVGQRCERLLDETKGVVFSTPRGSVGYFVGLAGFSIASELSNRDVIGAQIAVVQTVAGYFLIVEMLKNCNLLPEVRVKKFWSYFGLGLVCSLATITGLLLLIIPGIILAVRWMPAYGYLLNKNMGVFDALSESWSQTRPHFWAILLALVPAIVAYAVGIVIASLPVLDISVPLAATIIVSNALIYGASLFVTALGIATFAQLGDENSKLQQVFV
jgi:hypothetical protein